MLHLIHGALVACPGCTAPNDRFENLQNNYKL